MSRYKDVSWNIPDGVTSYDSAQLAVLMDIRDELKRLNGLIGCSNAVDIPNILRGIREKLPTKSRRRKRNEKAK